MRETDIMRILAEEEEEHVSYGSPIYQDQVYVIMWQSTKSGGTYTELRKSVRGKNRFLQGMSRLGVDLKEVEVIEVDKNWVPKPKSKKINRGGEFNV